MKTSKKNVTKKNVTKKNIKSQISLEKINNYNILFINNNKHLISIQSFILNGPIHEHKKIAGINHLLEHVLVNSYKKCKKFSCFEYLNKLSILFNAHTKQNILNYHASGLIENTKEILQYIVNIIINPKFTNTLIDKEKQAVHNELIEKIDNPLYELDNMINMKFYNIEGLKYCQDYKLQIKNLKRFNKKILLDYYKKYYIPNNILFVISGNYNKKEIKNYLSMNLPRENYSKKTNYNNIDCFTNKSEIFFIKNNKLNSTKIIYRFPTSFKTNTKDLLILMFTCKALKIILLQILRGKNDLIYSISIVPIVNICGTNIEIFINTKNTNRVKVIKIIKEIITKYKSQLISEVYLKAIKKQYLISFYRKNFTPKDYAELFGIQYIYKHFLDNKILTPEEIKTEVMKITTHNIKNIINKAFNFNKVIIGYTNNQ